MGMTRAAQNISRSTMGMTRAVQSISGFSMGAAGISSMQKHPFLLERDRYNNNINHLVGLRGYNNFNHLVGLHGYNNLHHLVRLHGYNSFAETFKQHNPLPASEDNVESLASHMRVNLEPALSIQRSEATLIISSNNELKAEVCELKSVVRELVNLQTPVPSTMTSHLWWLWNKIKSILWLADAVPYFWWLWDKIESVVWFVVNLMQALGMPI